MATQKFGEKLRTMRKAKGITLAGLSELSGFSLGYLSNLERDVTSPTLENVQKICEIFGISMLSFFEEEREESLIIRKEDRVLVFEEKEQIYYESIKFGNNRLDGVAITIEPGCSYVKKWKHKYDEIGIVLSGEMIITINNTDYLIKSGDFFYIKAHTEHSLKNVSDLPCESCWIKEIL